MTPPETPHKHRFRIAEPDGRKELPGACACGEERTFKAGEEHGAGSWRKPLQHIRVFGVSTWRKDEVWDG